MVRRDKPDTSPAPGCGVDSTPVAPELPIDELRRMVECEDAPEVCRSHASDATGIFSLPQAVAWPRTSEEVAQIVALANLYRFPVVPRGAGTGKSGGAVPVGGGLALSFERMTRMTIDPANLRALVEPGVVLIDLHRAAEAQGLFYPPDPASLEQCTLGGNIAENAGGPRCLKYGVTGDYVLGLTVVLGDGRVMKTGAGTAKSVAGYDLTRLIVGSEGTLAVVTEATLKLIPRPEVTRTLVLSFRDAESALALLTEVLTGGIFPCSVELIDAAADGFVRRYLRGRQERLPDIPPLPDRGVHLLVEVDGGATETLEAAAEIVRKAQDHRSVLSFLVAIPAEQPIIWKYRRSISLALRQAAPAKVSEDVVVPRARLAEAMALFRSIGHTFGREVVVYGHAGDGNLHVNILAMNPAGEDYRQAEGAATEIVHASLALGGSITGEHGIGLTKASFLPLEIGAVGMDMMRRIKGLFDPDNILNPGKIFL